MTMSPRGVQAASTVMQSKRTGRQNRLVIKVILQ